jgi:uncharacterized phage protein (TIGR01671 family)
MREIKFRRAHFKNGKFNRFTTWGVNVDHPGFKSPTWDSDNHDFIDEQFTGLHDKNGKEIYEGDVVEYDNGTIAQVIFKDGGFCGYDGYATSSDEAYTLLVAEETPFSGSDFELEVIGSIHENPKLIK